ncbi:MAG: hypothetical protein BWX83_00751 [Candidatus Cloacimonetes bacterium ADurb.Bin117]|nr:MAG: hypothetical protein BWX83_00751 [Candidatus Cloacimonetes bacterium ADurb.Bin117]
MFTVWMKGLKSSLLTVRLRLSERLAAKDRVALPEASVKARACWPAGLERTTEAPGTGLAPSLTFTTRLVSPAGMEEGAVTLNCEGMPT